MRNNKQSGKVSVFWKFLPLVLTVLVTGLAVKSEWREGEGLNQGALIFIPLMVPVFFPWLTAVSYAIQGAIKAKQLGVPNSQLSLDERTRFFAEKGKKWCIIFMVSGIITMSIFMSIPITFSIMDRAEEGTQLVNVGQPMVLSEGSNVHGLLCFFDIVIKCFLVISIISFILGAVVMLRSVIGKWWKSGYRMPNRWKYIGLTAVVGFMLPIFMIFIFSFSMKKTIRGEVKTWLENVSDDAVVSIDGRVIQNPLAVIGELRNMSSYPAHHSHATERYRVVIKDGDDGLVVELGRDSQKPEEYWIFYMGYRHTCRNEIGRVTSNLFEKY